MRRVCITFLLLAAVTALTGGVLAAQHTQAKLVLPVKGVVPGESFLAGIQLRMESGWHTYWRNAGDSGAPTEISWELPAGIQAGEIQWPVPEKYTQEGLTTYVYHDATTLLVPLTIAANISPGTKEIKAAVSWLECEKLCLPGQAEVNATIEVGESAPDRAGEELIDQAKAKLPVAGDDLAVSARWTGKPEGQKRRLRLEWRDGESFDFYPYGGERYEIGGATERVDGLAAIEKSVIRYGEGWPERMAGLIVPENPVEKAKAYRVNLALGASNGFASAGGAAEPEQGDEETSALGEGGGAAARGKNPALSGETSGESGAPSLGLMFLFAFIGGLILNFMPCVLPVISLKVLGFVNQSSEDPRYARALGLIFGVGVLVSFLILAVLVIGVKWAGAAASWGMQFQNPAFLVAMTVLVALVAMNLFGVFEVNLGGKAMGAAGSLAAREGKSGAFFNGVLATALATPCTAPFLAPALGFAFAEPAPVIVLMFLTIGLGLAIPYVLLSLNPGWLKFMPRPGAWMEKFKVAMGFPMLATAIWLFYLASLHFGKAGTLWLGIFLVFVATAVWIWGEFVQRGRKRKVLAMAVAVVMAVGGYWFALERQLNWRSPALAEAEGSLVTQHSGGIAWRPWSREAVAKARAAGHPVLVDFTAEWCLTCQVNKETSLEIEAVRNKLQEIDAVAFLADHTKTDPKITEALQRHGRAGVPLVLVYPADTSASPIVLPEVLTPKLVLNALERAAES